MFLIKTINFLKSPTAPFFLKIGCFEMLLYVSVKVMVVREVDLSASRYDA